MSDSSSKEPRGSLLPGPTYFGRFSPEKTKIIPVVRDDNLGVRSHVKSLGLPSPSSFKTPGGTHYQSSRSETPESLTSPGGSTYHKVSKFSLGLNRPTFKRLDFSSTEAPPPLSSTLSIFKAGDAFTATEHPSTSTSTPPSSSFFEHDSPFLFFETRGKLPPSKRQATANSKRAPAKAAMGGISAKGYVEATADCPGVQGFLEILRDKVSVEWGHVGAHCLGGKNAPPNLAVIPYDANSQMLVLETLSKKLSQTRHTKYESEMALIPKDPSEEETQFLHIAQEIMVRLTIDDAIEIKHHIQMRRPHCLERPLLESIISYLDDIIWQEDFDEALVF